MSDQNFAQKNRKEQEQKFTAFQDKIEERRHRVYTMNLQGFGNQEIAEKLGTSLSTIEKDLHHMRYFCLKWTKEILDDGSIKTFFDSCSQIDLVQDELWKMYRKEDNANSKKKILDSIVTNSIKKDKGVGEKVGFSDWHKRKLEELKEEMNRKNDINDLNH